jgi:hypothetical protein
MCEFSRPFSSFASLSSSVRIVLFCSTKKTFLPATLLLLHLPRLGAIVFSYSIAIEHKTHTCNMIDVMAVTREQTTPEKQLPKRRLPIPRVMKPMLQRAPDNEECDRTAKTSTSSSFFLAAPLKSCMKQARTQTTPKTKKVMFDSLVIHEHAVILGDNPSVSSGPPLAISWEAQRSIHLSLDKYEASRPPRRHSEEMHVPREIREEWLRQAGYARSHFAEIDTMVQKTKKERAASAKKNLMDVMVHKLKKGQSAKAFSNLRKLS